MKLQGLLTISEAAQELGVSVDTLRRWDESGKLVAIKKGGGAHRYYSPLDLTLFTSSIFRLAYDWVSIGSKIPLAAYCSTRDDFQGRLISMQSRLEKIRPQDFSLLVVMAGEIGNNSFDHNLGQWPDWPGIFFADDPTQGKIVLADRGIGLLATLRQVRPGLSNEVEALRTAFTETISGRAPENRGNGLKLVRQIIADKPIDLFFKSGPAELRLAGGSQDLHLTASSRTIQGTLALIDYKL